VVESTGFSSTSVVVDVMMSPRWFAVRVGYRS